MKVSIALCTYNGSKFIREQLDSYAAQTRLPDELVVCDDQSSDDTVAIVEAFAVRVPFPVRVQVNENRLGFNANFHRAVGLCTGEIIATSDQDDAWLPEKLACIHAPFQDLSVTAVVHPVRVADENLRPSSLLMHHSKRPGKVRPRQQELWFMVGGLALSFRASVIQPHLQRTRVISKWGDAAAPFDEWIYLLASIQGNVQILDQPLLLYRRHAAAVTADIHGRSSPAFQRKLALSVGSPQYEYMSSVAASRCRLAQELGAGADERSIEPLRESEAYYRRLARDYRQRACLYDLNLTRLARLTVWLRLCGSGGYRSRFRGGFGALSMLKDFLLSLLRARIDLALI